MSLSKRIRFEAFKRDKFTCQYCGKKAPDVILHADHVHPRAQGGEDTILNLITSCSDCNLGKGAVPLSDASLIEKQRKHLEELQERREQIDMMIEWQKSLAALDTEELDKAVEYWCELVKWQGLTEYGRNEIRKSIKRYGLGDVLTAMRTAAEQYLDFTDGDTPTEESAREAFQKIAGICATTRRMQDKPYLRDLYYIRKIAENRCGYFRKDEALEWLESAFSWGADVEELRAIARRTTSWSRWRNDLIEYITELKANNSQAN